MIASETHSYSSYITNRELTPIFNNNKNINLNLVCVFLNNEEKLHTQKSGKLFLLLIYNLFHCIFMINNIELFARLVCVTMRLCFCRSASCSIFYHAYSLKSQIDQTQLIFIKIHCNQFKKTLSFARYPMDSN